jgi:hypothetical protein
MKKGEKKMSEKDKHLVKVFDELRHALEVELQNEKRALAVLREQKTSLDSPIFNDPRLDNDPRLQSLKKEIESLKSDNMRDELSTSNQVTWFKSEILVLKALSPLFEQVFAEIDSLKDALQKTGAKNEEVKSIVEKREEVFRKIEKLTDDLAKDNKEKDEKKEKKDKWRNHDTA